MEHIETIYFKTTPEYWAFKDAIELAEDDTDTVNISIVLYPYELKAKLYSAQRDFQLLVKHYYTLNLNK